MSVTNSTYWSEIGHANGATDFDSNYWQQIKPGMNRFDDSGAGTQISSTDYSIWAQVGVSVEMRRLIWGNRDAQNQFPTTEISLTKHGPFRKPGRLRSERHKIFQARVATTGDPGATGNENDWHLIADTATMSSLLSPNKLTGDGLRIRILVSIHNSRSGSKLRSLAGCKKRHHKQPTAGTIKMTVSLASSNFSAAFSGLAWLG